jgi:flagellar hook-associated protein 1
MPGLFSIFNTAKSGLFSQQTAINVTSHNIANASTDGYSRQRANMVTTTPYTMPSVDSPAGAGQLGTGVTVESIERIRDTFIDYQYRVQNSINGQYTAAEKYLSQVEGVINEPTDSGLSTLMTEFFNSWQSLSSSTQNKNTVAQQAYLLTSQLNSTYSQLSDIKTNAATEIKNSVVDVNSIFEQLSKLNQQIIDIKNSGNNPNDLMDRRDKLLDELSDQLGIDVTEKDFGGIDVTTSNLGVEPDSGDCGTAPLGTDGKVLNVVQAENPDDVATLSYVSSITVETNDDGSVKTDGDKTVYQVVYYKKGDTNDSANKVSINVTMTEDEAEELDKTRVLWADKDGNALKVTKSESGTTVDAETDSEGNVIKSTLEDGDSVDFDKLALFKPPSGELKGYMSVQDNVTEYEDELNSLAKALALSVNAIISQSDKWTADDSGNPEGGINNFFVNGDADISTYGADDENGINASNITVNVEILNDPSKIKTATKYDSSGDSLGSSTDPNRAVAVAQLANSLMNIQDVTDTSTREDLVSDIFAPDSDLNNVYKIGNAEGGKTLNNHFNDIVNKIGVEAKEATQQVENKATQLANYEQSRESISGVSIDEEMTNLIQFQHCYQANAKAISTVDTLLDVVINGLKTS